MTSNDQPMDHVTQDAHTGNSAGRSDLEKNVLARSTWLRLVFMIIYGLLYAVSRLVTMAVVVVQFFHVLITGQTNDQLKALGHSLAIYSFEIVNYLTFNSEIKPFPLEGMWPTELPQVDPDDTDDD